MTEHACPKNVYDLNLNSLIQQCLKAEQDRNLSKNSIKELKRYLMEFGKYCTTKNICLLSDLTPDFLRQYTDQRCRDSGPNLKKAVVWSLRKLGKFLCLLQLVGEDPAKNLRHPKFNPRSELPDYLNETQLKKLLKYTADNKNPCEFAIICLLATTGLRPREVVGIKLDDVYLNKYYMKIQVKGGWIKKTAISVSMASVLAGYLATRKDDTEALFVNKKNRAVSVTWLQYLVKKTGKDAHLSIPLTSNCLRHTFATHAADKLGKIKTKALMGHQRLCTTEIYTHLSPRHFKGVSISHPMEQPKQSEQPEQIERIKP